MKIRRFWVTLIRLIYSTLILALYPGVDVELGTQAKSKFFIQYNPSLTSVSGLQKLSAVGDVHHLHENNKLESIVGLSNPTTAGVHIMINSNVLLNPTQGLENINSIALSGLNITGNTMLTNCDLPKKCTSESNDCKYFTKQTN